MPFGIIYAKPNINKGELYITSSYSLAKEFIICVGLNPKNAFIRSTVD